MIESYISLSEKIQLKSAKSKNINWIKWLNGKNNEGYLKEKDSKKNHEMNLL